MPTRIRPNDPSTADEVGDDLGQQDPDGIEALAGLRADQAPVARLLARSRRAVADQAARLRMRGVLDLARLDAPGQEVIAVDDDVEAAGGDRVDERQPGRALVEERLRVALRGVRAPSDSRSIDSSARPCVPTGRNAG